MSSEPLFPSSSRVSSRLWLANVHPAITACWLAATAIGAGLAYYHYWYEGERETMIFAGATTASLVSGLLLASRRVLFSFAVVAAIVVMIVIAADVKRRYIEMVLHAYDVIFYLTSVSTLKVLWIDHKVYLFAIAGSVLATFLLGATLFKYDPTRVNRLWSGVLLIIFASTAAWAAGAKGERRNTLFYWDNLYISSFYASWSETLDTLWRGQLIDAAPAARAQPFAIPATCDPDSKPPHILLIHQESVVPPGFFPDLKYDRGLDDFFRSVDGTTHKLRVETYGGASWLTEFSVIAGVSTYSFGGMRPFVQSVMRGKVHDTLPQALARCGYRNSVFYPVPKDFVSNGRFYAAAGMPEIFDYRAQGATRYNERDSFYYGNLIKHLDQHLKDSSAPVFTYLLTSATHLPYTYAYEPSANVPGGGAGTDPEMNEYLRRLALAKIDYDEFRAELQRRFPTERFLIVHYGDHQPVATRTLLGFERKLTAEDVKLTPDSPGLLTYYRIDALNYTPPPMPDVDVLDVPYLGGVVLAAARLPLSDANRERMRLLNVCGGRYYTCQRQDDILVFHRQLIDSGLIDAR